MGYFASLPQSARQLRPGRSLHARQRERFRRRRLPRHHGRRRRHPEASIPSTPIASAFAGHSYGGYMTMWAETQTHRFAAAVAGAGLSDWLSYYGLNDIDEWMIPFFGASVYDDPAVYAKSDPMHFVKNRQDAHAHPRRRSRRRGPHGTVRRVVARPRDPPRSHPVRRLSRRRPRLPQTCRRPRLQPAHLTNGSITGSPKPHHQSEPHRKRLPHRTSSLQSITRSQNF